MQKNVYKRNKGLFHISSRCEVLCFLSLFVLLALLFSITFEALHAGHELLCQEDDCPICLILQVIQSNKKIAGAAKVASVEFIFSYHINLIICSAFLLLPVTLVSQKIKLVI